ncbi:MAG TPA: hypothetical protein GX708_21155 [Gallicola sp.]|nr:hypothetical protein [Gallicola sp.]
MELNIDKIKQLIQDDNLKRYFLGQLELILVVEYNYNHITQLERLIDVMESGLSDYYKKYKEDQEYLTIQASIIAENTLRNHYRDEDKLPDVHSLYKEFAGTESRVKNYKNDYYKYIA